MVRASASDCCRAHHDRGGVVIAGDGSDSTDATQAYLAATDAPILRDLIIIGDPSNPGSYWLTDHEAPVLYPPYGTFQPAVVSRDMVEATISLDAQSLAIDWSPGASAQSSATVNTGTASPYQLARQHFFDNWLMRGVAASNRLSWNSLIASS